MASILYEYLVHHSRVQIYSPSTILSLHIGMLLFISDGKANSAFIGFSSPIKTLQKQVFSFQKRRKVLPRASKAAMETMPASYRLYPLQKDSGALVVL